MSGTDMDLLEACRTLQESDNPTARKIGDKVAQSFKEEANS